MHTVMTPPPCTTHQCPYPVSHLNTQTLGEGLICTCMLTGGHGAEKVTTLIHRVLVGEPLAPCPQFCDQGLTTFLHMSGTGVALCNCVLYCIV